MCVCMRVLCCTDGSVPGDHGKRGKRSPPPVWISSTSSLTLSSLLCHFSPCQSAFSHFRSCFGVFFFWKCFFEKNIGEIQSSHLAVLIIWKYCTVIAHCSNWSLSWCRHFPLSSGDNGEVMLSRMDFFFKCFFSFSHFYHFICSKLQETIHLHYECRHDPFL